MQSNTLLYFQILESENEPVLSFINNAELEELAVIPGCSAKKAETLHELRPFETFADLVCEDSFIDMMKHFVILYENIVT